MRRQSMNPLVDYKKAANKFAAFYFLLIFYRLQLIFVMQLMSPTDKCSRFLNITLHALYFFYQPFDPVSYTHLDVYKRQP